MLRDRTSDSASAAPSGATTGATSSGRRASAERQLIAGIARRVHLLGAGGAGLSGAAAILHAHGHVLSGHDRADSSFVHALTGLGIPIALGASERSLLAADVGLVAHSAAIASDDPQLVLARERGIRVLKYSELFAALSPPRRTLAVAGTHGKTTSSWMLYHALRGMREAAGNGAPLPGALIGGTCRTLGTNALAFESGGWFAAEACEYDRSFLRLAPEGAIITNVEADHLDYYGTLEAIEQAFACFVDRIHPDGLLVVGRDVPERVASSAACNVWRLGHEFDVELCGESHGFFRFKLRGPGWATPELALNVPGAFNVDNAALVLALAMGVVAPAWHLDFELAAGAAARAIHRYKGAQRRFEPWGTAGGVELIHDYAHHPTEVRATLEAARRALPGKPLHVLFQPHQHSRTARFIDDFVESLRGCDRVVIADVYGARAHIDTLGAGSEELVLRLKRAGVDAVLGGSPAQCVDVLCARLSAGSAALILGAGDIDLVKNDLLEELALLGPGAR